MGIKSFMGRRAKDTSRKEYDAPILVENYMSKKLVTFSPEQSILQVMELFAKHHISGGPVLDDNGFLYHEDVEISWLLQPTHTG